MSLDHFGFGVTDLAKMKAFYEKVLAPLGMKVGYEAAGAAVGFGDGSGFPSFFLMAGGHTSRVHVAFKAKNRAAVKAFYDAAIAAGAKDNGPPGMRAHYHANYYGAFVIDPDGHNIEAVTHAAE
jgi:catechol 2,3-dioxygenase-like lactoylglutathione lyase family enzyme